MYILTYSAKSPPRNLIKRYCPIDSIEHVEETCHLLFFSFLIEVQVVLVVRNLPVNAGDARDAGSIPGSGRSPEEGMQPAPVFLPGKSRGLRSLVGDSPPGYKESDTTKET